ncbi:Leucine-rich repeat transmembrane protein kinase [Prunus dulcis]|uniref:Leucine-rich repeat transmembrane protein kinase n=1 Tax=Prunus dulcis TaxID=3755 RepID=A0A5H2XQF9_PRUDU|nr:Leucine-rich repeat transmembrane protein kinase [Prunus dulcis]
MIDSRRMLKQPWHLSVSVAFFSSLCFWFQVSMAQNATTDPSEAMGHASGGLWNISGDPCSGSALNGTEFEKPENNPAITCDCTYDKNPTCHISKLIIDQNYFTGPLPAFIGNMSALMKLSIAQNSFSGPIPKELGNLKELTMLSFGSNNFSGTLPPELGNLVKLEELYIESCGLSGEIPSTFAKLINMRILRFQGNSFEGPIPTSFSQLTSLNDLRISDISNVSSSLDFIRNLKNLNVLVLRNALINGSIPSDIGEYQSLNNESGFQQFNRPTPKFFVQHEFSYILSVWTSSKPKEQSTTDYRFVLQLFVRKLSRMGNPIIATELSGQQLHN